MLKAWLLSLGILTGTTLAPLTDGAETNGSLASTRSLLERCPRIGDIGLRALLVEEGRIVPAGPLAVASNAPADAALPRTLSVPWHAFPPQLPGTYEPPRGFSIVLGIDDIDEAKRLFAALADGGDVQIPLKRRSGLAATVRSSIGSALDGRSVAIALRW